MNKETYKAPTVLSIAGFDGSGGAGIQADTKAISALGCYAMNILTALPVQNTQGVRNIFDIPTQAVEEQLACIFDDIYPDAVKIGMVHSVALVETISNFLKDYKGAVVFDPVMISTSGHQLIQDETIQACIDLLFPMATTITPNLDEVSVLVGEKVDSVAAMELAGRKLLEMGCQSVLVKGGHLDLPVLSSLLVQKDTETLVFDSERIDTKNTHGSGCTLSSAIASYLAREEPLERAVELALDYVHEAIRSGSDLEIGKGNGPLNHFHQPLGLLKMIQSS